MLKGAKGYLFGYTTGISYGTIQSIYSSANVTYSDETRYLTDLNCSMSQGDSGGPLTTAYGTTNQRIYGLNVAADTNNAYSIKIENVLNSLNVSIYSYD